ncbi:SOS response-associated peptidase [Micrococcus luteus]
MCGRYVMARATSDLVARGGAEPDEELVLRVSWNVAPTAEVPILVAHAGEDGEVTRRIHVARWGLVPPWAKELSVGSRAFNARSETVAQKPTFRSAVRARRCAVPVEGYYEWKAPEPGQKGADGRAAKKQPFYVHPAGGGDGEGPVIWFAGLYEWWKDPEAEARGEDPWVLSCSILTCASPDPRDDDGTLASLGALHDRLPVPLDEEMTAAWLEPVKLGSAEEAEDLVARVVERAESVASGWELRPVGTAVGNVRNNGPELIEPQGGVQERLV